jgi:nucleotide-binding universal stress UspA family protein
MTTGRTRSVSRILVLLDGSPLAECTLSHAVKLAAALGARVRLLAVTEPRVSDRQAGVDAQAKETAQLYLSRKVRLFEEFGIPVDTQVVEGHPAECAVDVARGGDFDLILLSTHGGRTGLTPFPLSGTASKVVAGAPMSVMVVRSDEDPSACCESPYETILAPVDLTESSYGSARLAAAVATDQGAELLLLTVIPAPEILNTAAEGSPSSTFAERLAELNRDAAERHLDALASELEGPVRVRYRIVEDTDVARALSRVAAVEDASLIVVGAHGRSNDAAYPHGVVATRLLEHVTRPVLVYQSVCAADPERAVREGASTPTSSSP